jgi:23S rRNA pseudouridine955/2504/2580 synthase
MTKDNIQTVRQFTVGTDDNDIRLDRWFKRHLPQVGFATISRWARTGQICVDGKRVAPEDRVLRGQLMRVPPATPMSKARRPARLRARVPLTEAQLELADSMVIHRDPAAIVINKPPALPHRAAPARMSMSMACSTPMRPTAPARVSSTVWTRTPAARCWSPPRRAAAFFSRRFRHARHDQDLLGARRGRAQHR